MCLLEVGVLGGVPVRVHSLRLSLSWTAWGNQMSTGACLPHLHSPLSSLFLPFFLERTKFPRWSLGKNMWWKGPFHPVQFDVVLGGAAEGACANPRGRGHVGWQTCRCRRSAVFIGKGKVDVGPVDKLAIWVSHTQKKSRLKRGLHVESHIWV